MPNLNDKFKQILEDLENNIQNKEDLEFIKVQIFNLYNVFYDEITQKEEELTKKMEGLVATQVAVQEKVEYLENEVKFIEKELYLDEDSDFTITCPYCNNEFVVECEDLKDEVTCPECNNIIELDWGDECSCGDDCEEEECSEHNCSHCYHDEEEDM